MSDTASGRARRRTAATPPVTAATVDLTPSTIERRAYEKFVARGFVHGFDVDDWIEAERELLAEVAPAPRDDAKPARATAAKPNATTGAKRAAATTGAKTTAKKTTAKKATAKKTTAKKTTGRGAPKKD